MVNRLALLFVLLFFPFLIKAQVERQPKYHVVCNEETFSGIARQYQTKVDSLKTWNLNVDPKGLKVGQRIIVGYEKVVKEQESDEQREENTNLTLDSGAVQPKGNTNVPPKQMLEDEPKLKHEQGLEPAPNLDPNPADSQSRSYSWVWLLFGVLIGLALGVALFYLLYVKKLKSDYKYLENELNQAKFDLNSEKTSAGSELSRLRSKIQSLDREKQRLFEENVSLGEEIDRLKAVQPRENENRMGQTVSVSTDQTSTQIQGSPSVLYADAIIDGYFVRISEVPNEDSIFVLHLNGENSANFGIYGPSHPRIIANPSFLEGCEKQILGNTMQLDVTEGRAQRDASNGKWKIIEKLNVIIK